MLRKVAQRSIIAELQHINRVAGESLPYGGFITTQVTAVLQGFVVFTGLTFVYLWNREAASKKGKDWIMQ